MILMALLISYESESKTQTSAKNQSSLVNELKAAIDREGIDGLNTRFTEIYPSQKKLYPYQPESFMTLISSYVDSGQYEIVQALGEINATLSENMIKEKLASAQPDLVQQMNQYKQAVAQAELQNKQNESSIEQKPTPTLNQKTVSRSDLDRFTGLYGTPPKQLWVSKSCEGQLVSGATWGDTAAWWMHTEADNQFSYQDSFTKLSMKFKLDTNKQATELSHDIENLSSPMVRTGPLTADYSSCIEPHKR